MFLDVILAYYPQALEFTSSSGADVIYSRRFDSGAVFGSFNSLLCAEGA